MKAFGSIPHWFDAERIQNVLNNAPQTPVFVYDFSIVRDKVAELRVALPTGVAIHYAMKANPLPAFVAAMVPLVDGIDIASGGELKIARRGGAAHISFAGPGKRDEELLDALRAGVIINLESRGELDRTLAIVAREAMTPRLAVRVNPDFALKGSGMKMGGGAAQFGIDAEKVPEIVEKIVASGAEWCGFHIFAGSQALDSAAIAATQAETVKLAGQLAAQIGLTPPLVNLGGGFGIPYFAGESEIDCKLIGAKLTEALDARDPHLKETKFAVELGRWLVGECGVYLTRVIDRKESRGETFLVTDGGLHHQLAASGNFGTVVRRNYPVHTA
jgi:diaminopimelate decarboxylase